MLCFLILVLSMFSKALAGSQPYNQTVIENKAEYFLDKKTLERYRIMLNKKAEEKRKEMEQYKKEIRKKAQKEEEEARKVIEFYESQAFQQKVENASGRILDWINYEKEMTKELYKDFKKEKKEEKKQYYLLFFFSKSMGNDLIRKYLKDLDIVSEKQSRENVIPVAVLYGIIKNKKGQPSLGDTIRWIQKLTTEHYIDVIIDPRLYRIYGITEVPAVVLARKEDVDSAFCKHSYYISRGISVFEFLEKVYEQTEEEPLKTFLKEITE